LIAEGLNSMAKVCWPYFDPEYENFSTRISPPRYYFISYAPCKKNSSQVR
jgi:hypothetical protein